MSDANGIPVMLPEEAYRLTERARLMSDAATEGMQEYGLGGLAYAKARELRHQSQPGSRLAGRKYAGSYPRGLDSDPGC